MCYHILDRGISESCTIICKISSISGQPDFNNDSEFCSHMWLMNGEWNDAECDTTSKFYLFRGLKIQW